ncbi:MAG: hypothetical protein ACOCTU_07250, partial [Bacteroidota bacterium]
MRFKRLKDLAVKIRFQGGKAGNISPLPAKHENYRTVTHFSVSDKEDDKLMINQFSKSGNYFAFPHLLHTLPAI